MHLRSRAVPTAFVVALAALGSCRAAASAPTEGPTRVVLILADGAGLAHWTLAAFADDDLSVRRMTTVGLVDTRGAEHTVSGSAPTATAYATGVRSFMGAVGVGPEGVPAQSVVEVAMERNLSTGLMTTTTLVDATPAAFAAHVLARGEAGEIARQMSRKGVTVLMGGGRRAFGPATQPDSIDLLSEIRRDYTYIESIDALHHLDSDTVTSLMGLFAEGGMGTVARRGTALPTMTSVALDILDRNPNGFFLMVENEETDTEAHRNADEATITSEMLDVGAVIDVALAYQARHPETLVIVTGDHETGGMSLPHDADREIVVQYATTGHTGALVPLFAMGPGAERFAGIIRNDRVGQILKDIVRGGGS